MTYSEKLKDPRWQKRRLEIMQRDSFACCKCKDAASTLHVHHKEYRKGKAPWDYPDELLETLCFRCHEGIHSGLEDELDYDEMLPKAPETNEDLRAMLGFYYHDDEDFNLHFLRPPEWTTISRGAFIAIYQADQMCIDQDILQSAANDGNFFTVMTNSGWKIKGVPVFDWIETYRSRLAVTQP